MQKTIQISLSGIAARMVEEAPSFFDQYCSEGLPAGSIDWTGHCSVPDIKAFKQEAASRKKIALTYAKAKAKRKMQKASKRANRK